MNGLGFVAIPAMVLATFSAFAYGRWPNRKGMWLFLFVCAVFCSGVVWKIALDSLDRGLIFVSAMLVVSYFLPGAGSKAYKRSSKFQNACFSYLKQAQDEDRQNSRFRKGG